MKHILPSPWVGLTQILDHRGLTNRCAVNPLSYCPDKQVLNSELSVFLLRARNGASYTPPPCTSSPGTVYPLGGGVDRRGSA
jgi:hypothetical protein